MPSGRQVRVGPIGPVMMLAVMITVSLFALATAVTDIFLPVVTGEEPFGLLFRAWGLWGAPYLFLHIFVHNFGLACLVPGVGFVAGAFETRRKNRRRIAIILVVSVGLALAASVQYLFQAGFYRNVLLVVLALVEVQAVLLLAAVSVPHVSRFIPTPAPGWSLLQPMTALTKPFLASGIILALASAFEVMVLMG